MLSRQQRSIRSFGCTDGVSSSCRRPRSIPKTSFNETDRLSWCLEYKVKWVGYAGSTQEAATALEGVEALNKWLGCMVHVQNFQTRYPCLYWTRSNQEEYQSEKSPAQGQDHYRRTIKITIKENQKNNSSYHQSPTLTLFHCKLKHTPKPERDLWYPSNSFHLNRGRTWVFIDQIHLLFSSLPGYTTDLLYFSYLLASLKLTANLFVLILWKALSMLLFSCEHEYQPVLI